MTDRIEDGGAALLPCPFCGGADLIYRVDQADDPPHDDYAFHVFCRDCHCHGRNHYRIGWSETRAMAAQAWNDRAGPDTITDLIEALEGVVSVADRKTVEFDRAHAAIARARAALSSQEPT